VVIVVVLIEGLRADHVGCYGNSWLPTPNLDRLGERSLVLTDACAGAVALPESHWEFLTGHSLAGWAGLPVRDCLTLPGILSAHGYHTSLITDEPRLPASGFLCRDFHTWRAVGSLGDGQAVAVAGQSDKGELPCLVEESADAEDDPCAELFISAGGYLRDRIDGGEKNVLLWIDCGRLARAWRAPAAFNRFVNPATLTLPVVPACLEVEAEQPGQLQRLRGLYAATVRWVDHCLGQLWDKLDELKLWDESLICLASSGGLLIGDHGLFGWKPSRPFGAVSQLVLMVKPPGLDKSVRVSALAQPVDLLPTILEIADIPNALPLPGKSLNTLLEGDADAQGAGFRPLCVSYSLPARAWRVRDRRYAAVIAPPKRWLFDLNKDPYERQDRARRDSQVLDRLTRHVSAMMVAR